MLVIQCDVIGPRASQSFRGIVTKSRTSRSAGDLFIEFFEVSGRRGAAIFDVCHNRQQILGAHDAAHPTTPTETRFRVTALELVFG